MNYAEKNGEALRRGDNWKLNPNRHEIIKLSPEQEECVDGIFTSLYQRSPKNFAKDRCQDAALFLLAGLWEYGLASEIMIGDVICRGQPVYNTTIKALKKELRNGHRYKVGSFQPLHCWIHIGGLILDPVCRWYTDGEPGYVLCSSENMESADNVYSPLVAGFEFILRTNSHPLSDVLLSLKTALPQRMERWQKV